MTRHLWLSFIFLSAAFLFLSIGTNVKYECGRFTEGAVSVSGFISSVKAERNQNDRIDNYVAIIRFTGSDGYEHEFRAQYYNTAMREGDIVTVYYPPGRYKEARIIDGEYFFAEVLILSGIILLFTGIFPLGMAAISKFRKKYLRNNGYPMLAVITRITRKQTVRLGKKVEYVIECRYKNPLDNSEYIRKSEPVSQEIAKRYSVGDIITVFFDPNHPKRYLVSPE